MINDPKFRDPLYPRDPALRNNDVDPALINRTEVYSGSGRTGLAVAVMLIALLVVALITFAGPGNVDPVTTASPGIEQQEKILPLDPAATAPDAAAPAAQQLPAAAPEQEAPAPAE